MRTNLMLVLLLGSLSIAAKASGSDTEPLRLAAGRSNAQAAQSGQYWVSGHYEKAVQAVLVEPARIIMEEIPATFETRTDATGHTVDVVDSTPRPIKPILIPARYEDRKINVWVPGHFVDVLTRGLPGME